MQDIITLIVCAYFVVTTSILIHDLINVYFAFSNRSRATLNKVEMNKFAYFPRFSMFGGVVFLKRYSVYEHKDGNKKFRVII